MRTIVLTGGGSGGHVIPIIALLPEILKRFDKVYYVGGHGIEKDLMKHERVFYKEIDTVGLDRKNILKNFRIPYKLLKSVNDLVKFFKEIKPDVIFSKGGYIALPAVIAGHILKIKVVAHESDMTLGLSNRIAKNLGADILCSFDKTATLSDDFKYVGAIIRDNVLSGDKNIVINQYKLSNKKTLLILGGSLGAKAINDAVISALPELTKNFNILHITGKNKGEKIDKKGYHQIEFVTNIGDYYAASDIIISRAGAGAIFEISALQKRAIFIPLPKSASRGDQIDNAKIAKEHGAYILNQDDLNRDTLVSAINGAKNRMTPISKVGNKEILDILTTFDDGDKSS